MHYCSIFWAQKVKAKKEKENKLILEILRYCSFEAMDSKKSDGLVRRKKHGKSNLEFPNAFCIDAFF